MDSVEGLEVALSADLLTMMINVDGWLCCLLSRCHEPIPSRVITVVALTAARGRESTLSTLSWHPVPRVAFACIPSAALGNLEVTAPAREPSLVTLISQTPCYHIRVFLSCFLCLPYSCLYRRCFLSCNSLAVTSYWRNLEESSIVYLYSHSASFPVLFFSSCNNLSVPCTLALIYSRSSF